MDIPYKTFIKTYVKKSTIENAGVGLFTEKKLRKFDWIGFYPGRLDKIEDIVGDPAYYMGTRNQRKIISADGDIKMGVHFVNEGNNYHLPNVFYVKLYNNYCLYFAGRDINKNEELITCYSNSYRSRTYPITSVNKCTDPRCKMMCNKRGTHRNKSLFYRGWMKKLREKKPKKLKGYYI